MENEGIEISNEKLQTILKALKTFLFKILKAGSIKDSDHAQIVQTVSQILTERTALREKMITAVATAIQNEFVILNYHKDSNNLKSFFE